MNDVYGGHLEGSFIRLLDVRTYKANSSHKFLGSFRLVSLNDRRPPEYTAISYCWGDSDEVDRIELPDDRFLPLSRTQSQLFNSLQRQCSNFTIWIDALCINQSHRKEKGAQVQRMGKVFSSAKNVLLWLGESDDISKEAFSSMRSKRRDQSGLESVFLLLRRPWFHRVWVIQEITVGRKVQMRCGDDHIDFDCFSEYIFLIWNSFTRLGDYDDEDPASRGFWCVTRLIHIRNEFQDKSEVCYETLLEAAFHCEATDKRDMVFAFRGIADNRPLPPPNYNISEEQVYIETAKALLCNGLSLDLLALCGIYSGKHSSSLPTWAPDLRHYSYSEPLVPCNRAGWKAGGPLQVSPVPSEIKPPASSEIEQPHRLRLQVKPVDVVDIICPPFNSYSVADQQAAIAAILALRPRVPGNISEERWMDRLVSALIWGLNIDDQPLEINTRAWRVYRKYFRRWLKWLQSSSCQEDLSKIRHNKYHCTIGPRIDGWMAFMTHRGDFCIGPPAIAVGDMVCIVPGCRLPLVLRPDAAASDDDMRRLSAQTWILVSFCFVEQLMFGEAAELEQPFEEILLR